MSDAAEVAGYAHPDAAVRSLASRRFFQLQ